MIFALLFVTSPLSTALSGYDNRLSLADLQQLSANAPAELAQLANDPRQSKVVRGRAIALLGNFDDATPLLALPTTLPAILRVKREKALRQMAERGADLSSHFLTAVNDADPFVRIEAAKGLLLKTSGRDAVIAHLQIEAHPLVREALARALNSQAL